MTLPVVGTSPGLWGNYLNDFLLVSHRPDGKLKHVHNVMDYGAVGDGVADDGPAIQAALDAGNDQALANNSGGGDPVYFPAGAYKWNRTLQWGGCSITGAGPNQVYCYWGGGSGGTAISTPNIGFSMSGLQFRGGTPGIWVNKTGGVDVWDTIEDCFFSQASIACIKTGTVTNFHLRRVRFNLTGGHAVWMNHNGGGSRNFSIKDWTVSEGDGRIGGIFRITYAANSDQLSMSIRDARIESGSNSWESNKSMILVDGSPGVVSTLVLMDNLDCQIDPNDLGQPSVYTSTSQGAAIPNLIAIRCVFGGFGSWMSGTYTYGGGIPWTTPALPSGKQVHVWATGREGTGGGPQNLLQTLKVGNAGNDMVSLRHGATVVSDGGTVTHGVGMAPTNVQVTPSVAGEIASVTAIGATTFTVALKKHDGTPGTSQTVYWRTIA